MDDVDPNALREQFDRRCPRHLIERGLGHVIGHAARKRRPRVRRTDDHRRAAVSLAEHLLDGLARSP